MEYENKHENGNDNMEVNASGELVKTDEDIEFEDFENWLVLYCINVTLIETQLTKEQYFELKKTLFKNDGEWLKAFLFELQCWKGRKGYIYNIHHSVMNAVITWYNNQTNWKKTGTYRKR